MILCLREENRVLKAQLRTRRLRLTDDDRRRLAVLGARLGRRLLADVATIVTPDTILRWHRQLVARSGRFRDDARDGRACARTFSGWSCAWRPRIRPVRGELLNPEH